MSESQTKLYDTLGVAPDATDEQIKKAFRKLAMQNHPDKNAGDEGASARFQAISEAYSILSDPEKRQFYDQTGEIDDIEIRPEEFKEQFQEMMAELMGGEDIMDLVAGMSAAEIKAMPPFPFPKELFPEGTFPPGMRFSCDGLAELPPSMMRALEEGDFGDFGGLAASSLPGQGRGRKKGGGGGSGLLGGGSGDSGRASRPSGSRGVKVGGSGRNKAGGAAARRVRGRPGGDLGDLGGFGGFGGFGDLDDFGDLGEPAEEEMMLMMLEELAAGRVPPGMPRDLVEELMAEAEGIGLPLPNKRGGKSSGGGLRRERRGAPPAEVVGSSRSNESDETDGAEEGASQDASLNKSGGGEAIGDYGEEDEEKERRRKQKQQAAKKKKKARQQAKKRGTAAGEGGEAEEEGEEGGDDGGSAASLREGARRADMLPGAQVRTAEKAGATDAARAAVLSAAAAAASAAFGEDEDDGTRGDEEDEEMDARAWLEAAKGGELARLVAGYAADPSLLHESSPGIGHTALHWCSARGYTESVRWLLSVGATAAQRNESGSTALHAAAANGQLQCARLLFEDEVAVLGACPLLAVRDSDGRTAAMIARDRGYAELAELLDAHTPSEEVVPPTPPKSQPAPAAPATQTTSPTSQSAAMDPLSRFDRTELTCLIDVLSALGDRRDPPLTAQQANCVAKLGSVLFTARLNR